MFTPGDLQDKFYQIEQARKTLTTIYFIKHCLMENLIVSLLNDEALQELQEMERNNKIHILNAEEIATLKARKQEMLKEVDNYTYENILKSIKNSDS